MLVNYVRGASPLVSPRGGTVAISADNLARATAGALTQPTQSASFPIGDCNISWDEMLLQLSELAGSKTRNIVRIPDSVFAGMLRMGAFGLGLAGAKTGLKFSKMHEFLLVENYIDPAQSQDLLGYGGGAIRTSLAATVASVPEERVLSWWRKLVNTANPTSPTGNTSWAPAR